MHWPLYLKVTRCIGNKQQNYVPSNRGFNNIGQGRGEASGANTVPLSSGCGALSSSTMPSAWVSSSSGWGDKTSNDGHHNTAAAPSGGWDASVVTGGWGSLVVEVSKPDATTGWGSGGGWETIHPGWGSTDVAQAGWESSVSKVPEEQMHVATTPSRPRSPSPPRIDNLSLTQHQHTTSATPQVSVEPARDIIKYV